jgi:ribonuclease Z
LSAAAALLLPVAAQAQDILTPARQGHFIEFEADALKVVVVGAGGPMGAQGATNSIAVMADGEMLLFDAGPGSSRSLMRWTLPQAALTNVFFTHYHSDHFADFGEVRLNSWVAGRKAPLGVYGPSGLGALMQGFEQVYAQDAVYRTAHHGPAVLDPAGAGLNVNEFALPAPGALGKVYEKGDLRVFAFTVDHFPVDAAVGYRVEYGDKSVVISGDTNVVPELALAAKGTDVLFADGLGKLIVQQLAALSQQAGRTQQAKLLSDILGYHMSPAEAAAVAAQAGAKALVFVHVTPPLQNEQMRMAYLMGVSQAYSGPAAIGQDGMYFVLRK